MSVNLRLGLRGGRGKERRLDLVPAAGVGFDRWNKRQFFTDFLPFTVVDLALLNSIRRRSLSSFVVIVMRLVEVSR